MDAIDPDICTVQYNCPWQVTPDSFGKLHLILYVSHPSSKDFLLDLIPSRSLGDFGFEIIKFHVLLFISNNLIPSFMVRK